MIVFQEFLVIMSRKSADLSGFVGDSINFVRISDGPDVILKLHLKHVVYVTGLYIRGHVGQLIF